MWTVNVDDKFRERFAINTTNPSEKHFEPKAVEEVEAAMVKLFGDKANDHKAKFAVAEQKNESPVYIGLGRDLIKMLKAREDIQQQMLINEVGDDFFVGQTVNFDWKTK